MKEPVEESRFPRWLLAILVAVALAILAGGIWFYQAQTQAGRRTVEQELSTIVKLRTGQIADGRADRLADAQIVAGNSFFAQAVTDWMARRDPAKADAILTEPHFAPNESGVHFDAIAPISAAGAPVAAVLLSVNAGKFLYPLIQTWPTPSSSAETLLARRDGEDVLYLNDLRHQKDTALALRIPLTRTELPAVRAILGEAGIFVGRDYRGVQVIAALAPVPDSSWFAVAKEDTSEAFAGMQQRLGLVLGLICLLVGALFGSVGLIYQREQKHRYRDAYQAEVARKAMLTRFEHIVKQANDIILLADTDQHIVETNDRASEIYGYSHDELLHLRFTDLVPPEEQENLAARVADMREGNSLFREAVHMKRDGTPFPVTVSSRMIDLEGRPYIQAILHDITESKAAEERERRLEQQLHQSQKLESLGVLAGGIAHDFNNILMAVLGHAELALAELPPASPARTDVLEITRASQRAAALCRQMLAYSGKGHFTIENVELGDLVSDMVQLLRTTLSKKAILNLRLEKGLPPIRGDSTQLSQVIMNLVINASEAIGDRSGVITICTGAQECSTDYLRETYADPGLTGGLFITLEVSDTGYGMDKETQQRLFEPFFTTKFTGRGLGLSAVLGIVRGHQGALKLYSEPGHGTTFKLLFPAPDLGANPALRTDGAASGDWRGEGTVLLADDEETIRAVGARMIESLGFKALVAADGREALNAYRAHMGEIVLVLLDLTMPHMDGKEAFRELRRLNPDVRVVMSSGYTESDIASRFVGKGLVGFLQKPYTQAELRERLRAALDVPKSTGSETTGSV